MHSYYKPRLFFLSFFLYTDESVLLFLSYLNYRESLQKKTQLKRGRKSIKVYERVQSFLSLVVRLLVKNSIGFSFAGEKVLSRDFFDQWKTYGQKKKQKKKKEAGDF